jgi:hypothetical protein
LTKRWLSQRNLGGSRLRAPAEPRAPGDTHLTQPMWVRLQIGHTQLQQERGQVCYGHAIVVPQDLPQSCQRFVGAVASG